MSAFSVFFRFLFVSSLLLTSSYSSLLNIEEFNAFNYDVEITKIPVFLNEGKLRSDSLYIHSKVGQKYECQAPSGVFSESEPLGEKEEEDEAEKAEDEVTVVDLLKPMKDGPCLAMTKDWWSYEFCYGKKVKQFHIEGGKVIGKVTSLGEYESDFDWSSEDVSTLPKKTAAHRYHYQTYANGAPCDLTGESRKTTIKFYCKEGHADTLVSVNEPQTCQYILTVLTPRVCRHPYLRPPIPVRNTLIRCHPVVSRSQYERYTAAQELREPEPEAAALSGDLLGKGGELLSDEMKQGLKELGYQYGIDFSSASYEVRTQPIGDLKKVPSVADSLQKAVEGGADEDELLELLNEQMDAIKGMPKKTRLMLLRKTREKLLDMNFGEMRMMQRERLEFVTNRLYVLISQLDNEVKNGSPDGEEEEEEEEEEADTVPTTMDDTRERVPISVKTPMRATPHHGGETGSAETTPEGSSAHTTDSSNQPTASASGTTSTDPLDSADTDETGQSAGSTPEEPSAGSVPTGSSSKASSLGSKDVQKEGVHLSKGDTKPTTIYIIMPGTMASQRETMRQKVMQEGYNQLWEEDMENDHEDDHEHNAQPEEVTEGKQEEAAIPAQDEDSSQTDSATEKHEDMP